MYTDAIVTGVAGFEWDKANWGKCQKHGLSIETFETILRGSFSVFPIQTTPAKRNVLRLSALQRTNVMLCLFLHFANTAMKHSYV